MTNDTFNNKAAAMAKEIRLIDGFKSISTFGAQAPLHNITSAETVFTPWGYDESDYKYADYCVKVSVFSVNSLSRKIILRAYVLHNIIDIEVTVNSDNSFEIEKNSYSQQIDAAIETLHGTRRSPLYPAIWNYMSMMLLYAGSFDRVVEIVKGLVFEHELISPDLAFVEIKEKTVASTRQKKAPKPVEEDIEG